MSPLAGIPTEKLIAELLDRKAAARAQVAEISRAIGERDGIQLADARLALEVAEAIARECNLECHSDLFVKSREERFSTPRKILHWALVKQHGWSYGRAALHCERDPGAIYHSVRAIAANFEFYRPVIARISSRLQATASDSDRASHVA